MRQCSCRDTIRDELVLPDAVRPGGHHDRPRVFGACTSRRMRTCHGSNAGELLPSFTMPSFARKCHVHRCRTSSMLLMQLDNLLRACGYLRGPVALNVFEAPR